MSSWHPISRTPATLFAAGVTLLLLNFTRPAFGDGIQLGTNVIVSFASVEAGRETLTRRDEFIAALTPLDRRARLQTTEEVSEKDQLELIGKSVRPWEPEETNRLSSALQSVSDRLARLRLPLPTTVLLIKTSGEEEFNNCYTRQNAIVYPAAEAAAPPRDTRWH